MDTVRYVIGIDGGGTKCLGVLADERGTEIARVKGGAANLVHGGMEKTIGVIKSVVEKLVESQRIGVNQVTSIVAGLAGAGRRDIREQTLASLRNLWSGMRMQLVTDADVALEGAFNGEPGIVLVAGTGSICYGKNISEQTARAGGWGHLLGDEGSATWVALEAIKSVLRMHDGRIPNGELRTMLTSTLGAKDIAEVVPDFYRGQITVSQIAGLSKMVFDLSDDDHAARQIVLRAGRELGKLVVAVAKKLQMADATVKVALVGGVFANKNKLVGPLKDEITRVCPDVTFKDPIMEPAMGAVLLAKKALKELA